MATIVDKVAAIIRAQGVDAIYKQKQTIQRDPNTLKNTLTFAEYAVKVHIRQNIEARELAGLTQKSTRQARIAFRDLPTEPHTDDRIIVCPNTPQEIEYVVYDVDTRTAFGDDATHILNIRKVDLGG